MEIKTIIITGGAGFIGSHFIRYIMKKYPNYRVICVDKLTYAGNIDFLKKAESEPRFRFVNADICDKKTIFRLFEEEKPNIVVNFAAESHVDNSISDPALFLHTNIMGTAVLLEACRKYGMIRFHQISTDEVYGELPLECSDMSFTEDMKLSPSSPYSCSKASADMLVLSYAKTYGLPVTISRCSNNYGERQFPEKLIPLMANKAMRNKPMPIYGDGKNVRDWIYVEDHCIAVDMIIHKGRLGEIYNIGAANELCNIDIVRHILKYFGRDEQLITFVDDRLGHDRRYAVNADKIRNELGWQPKTDFEYGFRKTLKWYSINRK